MPVTEAHAETSAEQHRLECLAVEVRALEYFTAGSGWDRPLIGRHPPFDQSLHIRGCAEVEWPLSTRAGPGPGVDIVPNLRFATVELLTGPRLHYAEQGAADGEPIVFLHGWPDSWYSFSRVIALLPQWLHAFVLDQRGFGDSERPHGGYSIADFAADAVAFLDAAAIDRATIVGHSFGSFVTRHIAITHPERVARMVLIGTAGSAGTPVVREVRAAIQDLQDPVPAELAREFQAGTAYALASRVVLRPNRCREPQAARQALARDTRWAARLR